MTKPQKLPLRTVPSDDLVITEDGVDYAIHAGETVTFKGRPSIGDSLLALRLQGISSDSNPADVDEIFSEVLAGLTRRISAWTWTDDEGNAYESPPTAETLRALSSEELRWLLSGGKAAEDSSPKD